MKKYIFTLILSLVTLFTYAQSNITSHVDMGTSIEWANCMMNVFYRYGEVNPTSYANESNYRFYSSLIDGLQWTYTNRYGVTTTQMYNGGFADVPLDIVGNPDYDPAVSLGEGWRLPTATEMRELVDNCDIKASTDNKYFIITSNVTGNIIVLSNVGYISYIGEHKKNLHLMVGQTSICEPRKYACALALNVNNTTTPDVSVRNYCSLDKVTCMFPILPVYSIETRGMAKVMSYNSDTGDVMYEGNDGGTYIKTPTGDQRRVKSYTSTSGITSDNPNTPGVYIVNYTNGDTEKVLIK